MTRHWFLPHACPTLLLVLCTVGANLPGAQAQDVTTQAMWVSSNTTIATVTSDGLLKVLQPGSCSQITATYQGISGTLEVNLGAPSGQGCWDY